MNDKFWQMISVFSLLVLTACGSDSGAVQHEDSEANDHDNIIQRVKPGTVIGSLSFGVDMNDYYLVSSEDDQDTVISVTNESGMDLILSEVNIFNQSQQSTNLNLINDRGNEVETLVTSSPHGYGYSTYIKITTKNGSGKYTLSIAMHPAGTGKASY